MKIRRLLPVMSDGPKPSKLPRSAAFARYHARLAIETPLRQTRRRVGSREALQPWQQSGCATLLESIKTGTNRERDGRERPVVGPVDHRCISDPAHFGLCYMPRGRDHRLRWMTTLHSAAIRRPTRLEPCVPAHTHGRCPVRLALEMALPHAMIVGVVTGRRNESFGLAWIGPPLVERPCGHGWTIDTAECAP